MALIAAVNSTAHLADNEPRMPSIGNSTEGALLLWLQGTGVDYRKLRLRWPPVSQAHFSSERKRMTTVVREGSRRLALMKGAAEWILRQSSHYLSDAGDTRVWTAEARAAVAQRVQEATNRSMRVLAFAYSDLSGDSQFNGTQPPAEALEKGLVYVGFAAIEDPLRADVRSALDQCRRAGIDVKMVTGDQVETARAVGQQAGLIGADDLVWDSVDFENRDDEEAMAHLPRLRILARARPLDKLRLVTLLQARGGVVAVTGDGTNDAPALKQADVGLAMGRGGTEVAKEASKIVILDDAFSTIVKAVHWGRALYENIQRFLQFQLTINASALAIAFLAPCFGMRPPFTILQLLWINIIMDTLAAIALCSGPPRAGLMRLPPKRRDENILTRVMVVNIVATGTFFVAAMIGLLLAMKGTPSAPGWLAGEPARWSEQSPQFTVRQVTIFFTVYVLFQVWNEINCRSLTPQVSGLVGLTRSPVFLAIVAVIVVGQVLIVTFGGRVFQVEPLGVGDWLAAATATASVLVFAEVARRCRMAWGWG
jgi:Ca2+-transporting ATPase